MSFLIWILVGLILGYVAIHVIGGMIFGCLAVLVVLFLIGLFGGLVFHLFTFPLWLPFHSFTSMAVTAIVVILVLKAIKRR